MSEEIKKRKPGRPVSEKPKNTRFTLRLNDDEYALLSELTDRLGVNKSKAIVDSIKTRLDILNEEEERPHLKDFAEKFGVTEDEAIRIMLDHMDKENRNGENRKKRKDENSGRL